MQLDPLATKQFNNSKPNRIRTPRRSRSKHPMRPIVGRRCAQQCEPVRSIKLPEHDKMREPLNISKPRFKLRQDRKHTIRLVLSAKPLGDLACVLVRTTHKSNRPRRKHRDTPPLPYYRRAGAGLSVAPPRKRVPHSCAFFAQGWDPPAHPSKDFVQPQTDSRGSFPQPRCVTSNLASWDESRHHSQGGRSSAVCLRSVL